MFEGHRVVPIIPAGRALTMSILIDHLRRNRPLVDEVQVWLNTDDDQTDDRNWLLSLPRLLPDFVTLKEHPNPDRVLRPKQLNTGQFYQYTQDPDTIYVRFDDDIVYLAPNYFENLLRFRLDNPQYLLVFGDIWNNAVVSWVHQDLGHIDREHGIVQSPYCMDLVGWQSSEFAEYIHRLLLGHIGEWTVGSLAYDRYELTDAHRFSISNFCFFGKDCVEWGGPTPEDDEEIFLTEHYPRDKGKLNAICGSALVSHFSFFAQRPHLLTTDILDQYREIASQMLSKDYYRLLGVASSGS